jgi:nucleotide-binding universal stress UspA family protein
MTDSDSSRIIRRIAVALDCSPHSLASLHAAAEMAGMLKAELIGIFVEDINLLRMGELPFIEEIRHCTASAEKIDPGRFERLFRLQAKEAGADLRQVAEQFMIPHTFRVRRGLVPEEVIAAALEADILVMGRSGRSPSCSKGLGSTAKNALLGRSKTVMFMRSGFTVKGPLLVLYDGSPGSVLALETALQIAPAESVMHVIIPSQRLEEAERLEADAAALLAGRNLRVEYHHLPRSESRMLVQFIRMIDSGLLVLSDRMALPLETLHSLISEIDYPVLLVRES